MKQYYLFLLLLLCYFPSFSNTNDFTTSGSNWVKAKGSLPTFNYTPDVNGILYVKKGATGTGDSWNNAVGELADALLAAATQSTIHEIWVAGGIYFPKYPVDGISTNPRDCSFKLVAGLKIYGNFAGTEATPGDRNLNNTANKTILDGNIGDPSLENDNTYHVVLGVNDLQNAILDGVTIRNGIANFASSVPVDNMLISRHYGAGLFLTGAGDCILRNLEIINNKSIALGGGIFCLQNNSLVIENSIIKGNSGDLCGGGISINSSPTIIINNTELSSNSSTIGGGIYAVLATTVSLNNVTINYNIATSQGAGFYGSSINQLDAYNIKVRGNSATTAGGAFSCNGGKYSFVNALITGNFATNRASAFNFLNCDYMLINNTITGNSNSIAGYTISTVGPVTGKIYNTVLSGNTNGITPIPTPDIQYSLIQEMGADNATHRLNGLTAPQFTIPVNYQDAPTAVGELTLMSASPLKNAGSNDLYPGLNAGTLDLNGQPRVANMVNGGKIDIGAYEISAFPQTIAVNPITKNYGDADFNPGATASSGLAVQYSSADKTIADAYIDPSDNTWKIKIIKAGTVQITASQPGDGTYADASNVFTLTIKKAELTITANDDSKTYDGIAYTGGNGVTYTGLVKNETPGVLTGTLSYTGSSQNAINANYYSITPTGFTSDNYSITYSSGQLTISKATLTVTAKDASKTYNAMTYNGGNGVDYTGFVTGETSTIVTGTVTYGGNAQNAINSGTYTIIPAGLSAPNYNIQYVNGTLTVNKAPLIVTAVNDTKTYDGLAYHDGNNITFSGFVNNEPPGVVTGVLTYGGTAQNAVNAGTYSITPSGLSAYNYSITYVDGTLTIDPATLTITARNDSKTYDGLGYTDGNDVDFSGFVNGENQLLVTGNLTYNGDAQNAINTGTYHITPAGLNAPNYTIDYVDGTLTINPAALTITARNDSKTYDGLSYSGGNDVDYAGFVNGENQSLVIGNLTYNGDAQNAINTGTYHITPAGLNAPNYTITYVDGTLTIDPATLTVTARNDSKTYDGLSYSGGNDVDYTGFVNGENQSLVTGNLTYNGDAQNATNTGTYYITPAGLNAPNYNIDYIDGTLTIDPATLTVTARNDSKIYDGLSYSGGKDVDYAGFVNGESQSLVTGNLTYNGDAQNAINTGTYHITPAGLNAPNYTIDYVDGTLTINPAALTITARNDSKTYDGLSYSGGNDVDYAGFVNGENQSLVIGNLTYNGDAQNAINTGTYHITPAGLNAPNYTIDYVDGTLTINPATLTVTARNDSKTYDGLSYIGGNDVDYAGFVNGENQSLVTGNLIYNGDAQNAINTGTYHIAPTGLNAPNYTIDYVDGTLTIDPAILTVTARNDSKIYDGLSYSGGNNVDYSGFVNGESQSFVTGYLTYNGDAQNAINSGTYHITPAGLNAPNYTINYVDGTLIIAPKTLTVTARNDSKTYDGLGYNGGNDVDYAGFVNGENQSLVTGNLIYNGDAQNAINTGTYHITPAGLNAPNYTIDYVDGTLTIDPATLTVTARNDSKTYDGLSYSGGNDVDYAGFVNGENQSLVTGNLIYNGDAQNAINTGTYQIIPNGLNAPNYSINYANGSLTISTATLTVTAKNDTKTYDGISYNGGNDVDYSGFVNNEGISVVTGVLSYTGSAQNAINSGTYIIVPSGLSAYNYTINYVVGTLTINKAPLTITARNDDKTYDGVAYSGGNYVDYSGFVNNESETVVTGNLTYGGTSQGAVNTGTYDILPSGQSAVNYSITYLPGNLTINRANLTVIANDATKTYDGLPYTGSNGITVYGLLNGETQSVLGGSLTFTGTSQGAIHAGSNYLITPSGLISNNYNISFQDGNLTIQKAGLIIKALNVQKTYDGQPYNGGNGVSYSGLVSGETAAVLGGNLSYSGNSQGAINTGSSYKIIPDGLTSIDYQISFEDGILTINPATLIIQVNNVSKCYGDNNPTPNINYSGFVNNESLQALTSIPIASITAQQFSPSGNYPILVTGATAPNYNIIYQNGFLVVNPLPVFGISSSSNILCDANSVVNLTASGNLNLQWMLDNSALPGNSSQLAVTKPGTYSAIGTDMNGCVAAASNKITINQQAPIQSDFSFINSCINVPVQFINHTTSATGNLSYTWTSGNGQQSNQTDANFTYMAPGTYDVTLTAASDVCPLSGSQTTKSLTIVTADPGLRLPTVTTSVGRPTRLKARTIPGATYNWTPTFGLSAWSDQEVTVTLDNPQKYLIKMDLPSGCTSTDTLLVVAIPYTDILVANAFTPNGDGQNDILRVNLRGMRQLSYFRLYNRSGFLVFETNNEKIGWDGKLKGVLQPFGTYVWMAEAIDNNGKVVQKTGSVVLIQ
ncbi:PKD domain-containing protein [Chitinophaga silvatica]|uniref:PKD domain-containing protein n=1 Tax=Chitinophaga silvatica TaxID=2282649 RepID=A0A3E1Y9M6_9BACT|nr:MBG domain-containing protein [Chitinophaga silvatica]RFS21896.1 PKD domain-containing protein [Chitinophaga silvatica]